VLLNLRSIVLGALLAFGALVASTAAAPGSAWVANVAVDGVPIRIEERHESAAAEAVAEAYVAAWRGERPGESVVRSLVGPWLVIGQRDGLHYRTAQFTRALQGGTRVLLGRRSLGPGAGSGFGAASAPRADTHHRLPSVPLPAAARAIRTFVTTHGDHAATQTYAVGSQPAASLLTSLDSLVTRSGWQPAVLPTHTASSQVRVRAWQRGDEELLAVAENGRPSTLLIHHVRRLRPQELAR
jgi:hypothetical protein